MLFILLFINNCRWGPLVCLLQDTYRVLSAADREYINEIARQSGDLLTMTTYAVQNYKLRFHEGKHCSIARTPDGGYCCFK